MKKISDNVLALLCTAYGIKRDALTYFAGGREDSDGILYTCVKDGTETIIKLVPKPLDDKTELEHFAARIAFAGYLGDNGVNVAAPLHEDNGGFYRTVTEKDTVCFAYRMRRASGENPATKQLTDAVATSWGRLIGKTHRLTKKFPLSHEVNAPSYIGEIQGFTSMCRDETVKAAWNSMNAYITSLDLTPEGGAFIHNDDHCRNILLEGEHITLIDFDCACRQFFIQDIMTAGQGLMIDETGGIFKQFTDADRLRRFYHAFIDGYESENSLDPAWYERLGEFIQYRRLLLYTCMEGWLSTQPEMRSVFIQTIEQPPEFKL